jgi:hypothetical protein
MEFDQHKIIRHINDFYRNLIGISEDRLVSLSSDFWSEKDKLDGSQQQMLEAPFTLEEVKKVIFSFNPSKALGPDGFSFYFYQECWELIFNDFMQLVHVFYNHELDLIRINLACICLIPKKADAQTIT